MKTIIIHTVPHLKQRYDTAGDYVTDDMTVRFTVSALGNEDMEWLVMIHELIEQKLTEKAGISEENITAFDVEYENNRKEGDELEPGNDPSSPYYHQHQYATIIERLLADKLGVDWNEYDKVIENL